MKRLINMKPLLKKLNSNYSTGNLVKALKNITKKEEFLGEPEHDYKVARSEEWAKQRGYYPDQRGHINDAIKLEPHPSHPSRGKFKGLYRFNLSDKGFDNSNYTLFGLVDNNQDPLATLYYKGAIVLPEITVTPKLSYIMNPYDNIKLIIK